MKERRSIAPLPATQLIPAWRPYTTAREGALQRRELPVTWRVIGVMPLVGYVAGGPARLLEKRPDKVQLQLQLTLEVKRCLHAALVAGGGTTSVTEGFAKT